MQRVSGADLIGWLRECSEKRELYEHHPPIPTASNRSRETRAGTWSEGAEGCTSRLGQVRGRNRLEGSQRNLEHLPRVCRGLCRSKELGENADAHSTSGQEIRRQCCRKDAENCSDVGVTVKVMGQCGGGQ